MKKIVCLLLCMTMLQGMTLKTAATEAEPEVTVCSHSWTEAGRQDATCTQDGQKTLVCALCGETDIQTIPAAGHSYGNWISADEIEHSRICSRCGGEDRGTHSQNSEVVTQQPSCTAEGKKDILCICGYKISENVTVPKTEHSYSQWTVDSATHSRTCSLCQNTESGAHKWGAAVVTREASCKEEGEQKYTCSVCSKIKLEIVPKLKDHTYDNGCDDTCNVCQAKRSAGHKYSSRWSADASGHWHECTVCKEKVDVDKHLPGPKATEEAAQVCLTCGYEIEPKKKHEHKMDTQWSYDAAGHWHGCVGCEKREDEADHVYNDPCDKSCNICGYKNPNAHEFGDDMASDDKGHWAVCSLCGERKDKEAHVPGPEATENLPQLCEVCGYVLEAARTHDHMFGPGWERNASGHWQECECGETTVLRDHTWDNGKEQKGNKILFTCTECGQTRAEVQQSSNGMLWVLLIVLLILLAGTVVALVLLLRRKNEETEEYQ